MARIKMLLVDDELDFLDLMRKRLQKRNVDVMAVPSGEEGVRAVQEHDFDVVVLDVRMPGMNGLEVLREIKRIAPELEVIILTGHANLEYVDEGLALGAFDYLIKPVAFNDLLSKVTDASQKRRCAT